MPELGGSVPALIAQVIFFTLLSALIWLAVHLRNKIMNGRRP